ncbi:hypothetical protein [Pseudotamlana carrageenivorans]|uniref:Lipoprotein n=1 Tax=Pseudotamlana carrageenivorans TaxID=2069432 RepID=A0A2I7SKE6_9FLAO|nr:hypothetical protein [Tamlana carrageenivorans]AUS06386.1 hypothetical protein C1A40_13440 [Tamlana carrageenivorans]
MENLKINITWWKVCLFLIITVFSCTPEAGKPTTYTYTLFNESDANIKIIGFSKATSTNVIILEKGKQITQTYKDGLPPRGYTWEYFYGSKDGQVNADSIKVIFNERKFKVWSRKNYDDERNPLFKFNEDITQGTFTFTQEDYNNAQDCNGTCN